MLIEGDKKVSLVAGRKDLAGANPDLKNRRAAGDGRWDCHVGHDFLVAATGQASQYGTGRLNAVLRIAGQTDDSVSNALRPEIGPSGSHRGSGSQV
jgi:hypothetical protein